MKDTTSDTPLGELINQVRLLFHQAVSTGNQLHRDAGISMSMRAVLEQLAQYGATSVPDMARRRNVTRQHIQQIVNDLLEAGLVTQTLNPAHKRSHLIAMTPDGERLFENMRERERAFYTSLATELDGIDLTQLANDLAAVRAAIASRAEQIDTVST
ncbi:MAG: MarR family transcriptional regulator [Candidatus Dadabacteria bacterium]|nr:MAG: MarR family transcriptional regulator [Candidatus Dadabacteria bacterium]